MVQELNELGLYNAVYVPNSKPIFSIRRQKRDNRDFVKFIFLSRIHPDKGIREIIEACRILNKRNYQCNYCVDFYGAIENDLKNDFLSQISIFDNLQYMGILNLTDIKGYQQLSNYDVMLFPTYWDGEGFPGVVIDAYISGLPVIATEWNLNREVIA